MRPWNCWESTRALGTALRERGLTCEVGQVVDELFPCLERELSTTAACRLTGRSRATHYRRLNPPAPRESAPRPAPASALSAVERAEVLALLNRPDYADLPPAQVWARELDEGRYWCSERTMYRILSAAGQNGERRRLATHPAKTVPQLVATAPCQVLTWSGSRRGSHPPAPTEPCVTVSRYTALVILVTSRRCGTVASARTCPGICRVMSWKHRLDFLNPASRLYFWRIQRTR